MAAKSFLNITLLAIGITAIITVCMPWSLLVSSVRDGCKPYQVHVSLTGDVTQMRVSWTTDGTGCMNNVSYWLEEHKGRKLLQSTAEVIGITKYYQERMMCSNPAARDSFDLYQHTAVLTDLVPGAEYSYQITGMADPIKFIASAPIGRDEPLTFVGFGDYGYKGHWKCPGAGQTLSVLKKLATNIKLDLIVHVGDLAYADGHHDGWSYFMSDIEPLAQSIPYMVTVGNHEYDYFTGSSMDPSGVPHPYHPPWGNFGDDSGGECGVMTAARFTMPMADDDYTKSTQRATHRLHGIHTSKGNTNNSSSSSSSSSNSLPLPLRQSSSSSGSSMGDAVPAALDAAHNKAPAMASSHQTKPAPQTRSLKTRVSDTQSISLKVQDGVRRSMDSTPAPPGSPASSSESEYESVSESNSVTSSKSDSGSERESTSGEQVGVVKAAPKPNSPFWYSYDAGSVHFISLSSEHDLNPDSAQHEWLVKDLEKVKRCVTPWVVVLMHRPMYVVQPHKDNQIVGEHIRASIEPLLHRYSVDLVLSGHVHLYARTCAVLSGNCITREQGGIYHFVAGTAGHELSGISHIDDWFDSALEEYGLMLFTVSKAHMKAEFISSENGKVLDSVTLKSQVPPGSVCK